MAKTPSYTYANVTVPNGGYSLSGGAGLTYSTASGAQWATTAVTPYYTQQPKVKISDQDIELDGLSLKETMQAVRDELLIPGRLNRNDQLEREFTELKEMAEKYMELERKFLEQKKMWETLKSTD